VGHGTCPTDTQARFYSSHFLETLFAFHNPSRNSPVILGQIHRLVLPIWLADVTKVSEKGTLLGTQKGTKTGFL